ASTTVGVAGGAGTLSISSSDLGFIPSGWGGITLGNANDTGLMTVAADASWNAPVTVLTKSSGSISGTGNRAATGRGSLTFTGGPVTLSGNLPTANQIIVINPALTLGTGATINSGTATTTFGSTVDGAHSLTASAGTFSLAAAWGGTTPLSAASL